MTDIIATCELSIKVDGAHEMSQITKRVEADRKYKIVKAMQLFLLRATEN